MSLSNAQLQDVLGEGNDPSVLLAASNSLRLLEPVLLEMIGRRALASEDVTGVCDDVREALGAIGILERLHGYCGSLEA